MIVAHEPDCTAERLERFTTVRDNGLGAITVRCLSCGGQWTHLQPDRVLEPGSQEYRAAWQLQPSRIVAQLDPRDYFDPEKNPLHPMADSTPPGYARTPLPSHAHTPQKWSTHA